MCKEAAPLSKPFVPTEFQCNEKPSQAFCLWVKHTVPTTEYAVCEVSLTQQREIDRPPFPFLFDFFTSQYEWRAGHYLWGLEE